MSKRFHQTIPSRGLAYTWTGTNFQPSSRLQIILKASNQPQGFQIMQFAVLTHQALQLDSDRKEERHH